MKNRETVYLTLHSFYEYTKDSYKKHGTNLNIQKLKAISYIFSNKELNIIAESKAILEAIKSNQIPEFIQENGKKYFHKSIDCPRFYKDYQGENLEIKNSGSLKYEEGKTQQLKKEIEILIHNINTNPKFSKLRTYYKFTSILFIDKDEFIANSPEKLKLWNELDLLKDELIYFHQNFKIPLRYKIIEYFFQSILGRNFKEDEISKFGLIPCICYNTDFDNATIDAVLDPNSEYYNPDLNYTPEEIKEIKAYLKEMEKNNIII